MHINLFGKINNRVCSMLLDTASDFTMVNPRLFSNNLESLKTINKKLSITTTNGSKLDYIAIKRVIICINNISIPIDAVFADIKVNCILGLDFISKTGLLSEFQSLVNQKFNENSTQKIVSIYQTSTHDTEISYSNLPEFLVNLHQSSSKLLSETQKKRWLSPFLYKLSSSQSSHHQGLYANSFNW